MVRWEQERLFWGRPCPHCVARSSFARWAPPATRSRASGASSTPGWTSRASTSPTARTRTTGRALARLRQASRARAQVRRRPAGPLRPEDPHRHASRASSTCPRASTSTLVEGDASADERVIPIQYEGLAARRPRGRPHPLRRRAPRAHGRRRRGRARARARRAGRRDARPRRRAPAQQDDAHLRADREGQGRPGRSASRAASTTSR